MVRKDLEQMVIELGMTAKKNLCLHASIVLDQDVDGRVSIVEFIQGLMPNRSAYHAMMFPKRIATSISDKSTTMDHNQAM
jgi:hypothetical protein